MALHTRSGTSQLCGKFTVRTVFALPPGIQRTCILDFNTVTHRATLEQGGDDGTAGALMARRNDSKGKA